MLSADALLMLVLSLLTCRPVVDVVVVVVVAVVVSIGLALNIDKVFEYPP